MSAWIVRSGKAFLIMILCCGILIFPCQAGARGPVGNLGEGLDDIIQGLIGSPEHGKGCDQEHGRGAARFMGGIWKVATFWYPQGEAAPSGKSDQ